MSPHRYNFNISIETENMFFKTHEALLIIRMNLPQEVTLIKQDDNLQVGGGIAKTVHDNTLIRVIYHI